MYMGAVTEEHPTPRPPTNLKKRNVYQSIESAEPTAETKNNTAIQNNVFLRPSLSEGIPPSIAPATVPINAMETVRPCSKTSSRHSSCIFCSAPEITAVSNPKRNPPKAITTDQVKILFVFIKPENFVIKS